jgi:hypothetical protein
MRTFIGLSFTWLPNRVRPDQVLVPFVPTMGFFALTTTRHRNNDKSKEGEKYK